MLASIRPNRDYIHLGRSFILFFSVLIVTGCSNLPKNWTANEQAKVFIHQPSQYKFPSSISGYQFKQILAAEHEFQGDEIYYLDATGNRLSVILMDRSKASFRNYYKVSQLALEKFYQVEQILGSDKVELKNGKKGKRYRIIAIDKIAAIKGDPKPAEVEGIGEKPSAKKGFESFTLYGSKEWLIKFRLSAQFTNEVVKESDIIERTIAETIFQ